MGTRWMPWPAGPMKGAATRRYTSGSGWHATIRGFPNGATRAGYAGTTPPERIGRGTGTGGTETSQYPEERKANANVGVAASETARAQTGTAQWPAGLCGAGVGRPAWGRGSSPGRVTNHQATRTPLEGATAGGESPVGESVVARRRSVSTAALVQCRGKLGRPRPKAKYLAGPIADSTAREW